MPPPLKVIQATLLLLGTGELFGHLAASLSVIAAGFGLAVVAGLTAALALHSLPSAARLVLPVADAARTVSAIALMPALIVLVGIGFQAKAIVIFWTAWPAVLINALHGLSSVDRDVQGAARVDGCGELGLLRVLVPVAAPTMWAGVRLAAGGAWISLVAAEMLGSNSGLGFLVLAKSQAFDFPGMWAAVGVIAVTGLAMNSALNNISWRFDHEKMDSRQAYIAHAHRHARDGRHALPLR